MQQSREQIESYIGSKGYFDSEVTDSVFTEKRKSDVYYKVDLSSPYTIRRLIFEIEDTTIRKLFYFDSVNCLIERGKPYDVDVLQSERTRLERTVKDRGFYGFSGDHIFLISTALPETGRWMYTTGSGTFLSMISSTDPGR